MIAVGAHWRSVWHESGNNADGIVATPHGVLVAQQDSSDVVLVDPAGQVPRSTRIRIPAGPCRINSQRQTFVVERGLHQAIREVAPDRRLLADTIDGDPLDCLGSGGLNDLTAAASGGVYFTLGNLYYAAPGGTITRQGDVTGTNGIILSPDEKRLYVTSGSFGQPGNLVVFDVQPDGILTNEKVFAHLTGGGDGSTVDSEGRIYVSSGTVIDVIAPDDGHLLGVIPLPQGDDVISLTFGGPGKRTLYAVALNHQYAKGGLGLPSDHVRGGQGGELVAIRMLARGYPGRAK